MLRLHGKRWRVCTVGQLWLEVHLLPPDPWTPVCICCIVPTGLAWCNEHGLCGQAMCEWWNVQCVSGLLWTPLYLGAEHVDYHLLRETV